MPSAMPMAAMRMKNTEPPNTAASGTGVVAAVAADHQVVGYPRENLAQLRQYDGQGRFNWTCIDLYKSRNCIAFRI